MSFSIQEMHYDYKVKLDKVDSQAYKNLDTVKIDWILNDAYYLYLDSKYGINNLYRVGFEVTQKRIDDLAVLHIKQNNQPALTPTLAAAGIYEVDLNDLAYPYAHLTRIWATASTDSCSNQVMGCIISQNDDMDNILGSPFYKPSFIWREIPINFGRSSEDTSYSSVFLYTNGEFTIDEVYIEYLKEPEKLWFGDYDYYDSLYDNSGTLIYQTGVDNPVGCELPNKQCREIVDIAVNETARFLQDPEFLQLTTNRKQINE